MIDEDLNVFVMEVNMSPNMTPAEERFERNSMIYEPMIYTTIQMIGGANYAEFTSRFTRDFSIINEKNLATRVDKCIENDCISNCNATECELCLPCLDDEMIYSIREAHRECKYQGDFARVFPTHLHYDDEKKYGETIEEERNRKMGKWYMAMCYENPRYC